MSSKPAQLASVSPSSAQRTRRLKIAGLWLEQGDLDAARADYRRVLELDPRDADAAAQLRAIDGAG